MCRLLVAQDSKLAEGEQLAFVGPAIPRAGMEEGHSGRCVVHIFPTTARTRELTRMQDAMLAYTFQTHTFYISSDSRSPRATSVAVSHVLVPWQRSMA